MIQMPTAYSILNYNLNLYCLILGEISMPSDAENSKRGRIIHATVNTNEFG